MKSLCKAIELRIFDSNTSLLPKLSSKDFPPKCRLFLWMALRNNITTRDNLRRRGVRIEDEGRFVICNDGLEEVCNLLLHCPKSWILWCRVFNGMNVDWVCPRDLGELMVSWKSLNVNYDSVIWDWLPFSLAWAIWLGRNEAIFNSKSFDSDQIWDTYCMRVVG